MGCLFSANTSSTVVDDEIPFSTQAIYTISQDFFSFLPIDAISALYSLYPYLHQCIQKYCTYQMKGIKSTYIDTLKHQHWKFHCHSWSSFATDMKNGNYKKVQREFLIGKLYDDYVQQNGNKFNKHVGREQKTKGHYDYYSRYGLWTFKADSLKDLCSSMHKYNFPEYIIRIREIENKIYLHLFDPAQIQIFVTVYIDILEATGLKIYDYRLNMCNIWVLRKNDFEHVLYARRDLENEGTSQALDSSFEDNFEFEGGRNLKNELGSKSRHDENNMNAVGPDCYDLS